MKGLVLLTAIYRINAIMKYEIREKSDSKNLRRTFICTSEPLSQYKDKNLEFTNIINEIYRL